MTDIVTTNPNGLAPIAPALTQTDAVVQLQEWAAELRAAHSLGLALAQSSFLPMSLRKKGKDSWKNVEELTNDAAAVILAGKSVGLDPMQAVQNIFPVHGMPSMYARTMVALVIGQGHGVRRSEANDTSVTYSVRRKGDDDWQDFTWTIDRAKKAGYTSNAKYQSDPIAMLGAKAAAEACRTVFPDILLGMAYSAEEIELEDMGEQNPARPQQANGQSATERLALAAKEAAPAVATEKAEPAAAPLCSRAQQTKLANALKAMGHESKEDMLRIVAEWIQRPVKSAQELTVTEANQLTEELLEAVAEMEAAAAAENQGELLEPGAGNFTEAKADAIAADAAWLAGN